ncbi:MAG: murein L,D-transpeptidase catalytic domain family protein [Gammaproteobacteria bacterium]
MKKLMKYPIMLATLLLVGASAVGSYLDMSKRPLVQLLAQTQHLEETVLSKALTAFNNAVAAGVTDSQILTIIDYSKASSEPRLWVFDLANSELLYEELVAHGRGSGGNVAEKFSNTPESYQSSIGVFITEETYTGRNGYSLRLEGLEEGINHLARNRAIVIHGANYVSPEFVEKNGRLGRSHGCPAVSPSVNKELINTIKGGSLVFAYYPNQKWLSESEFLHPAS